MSTTDSMCIKHIPGQRCRCRRCGGVNPPHNGRSSGASGTVAQTTIDNYRGATNATQRGPPAYPTGTAKLSTLDRFLATTQRPLPASGRVQGAMTETYLQQSQSNLTAKLGGFPGTATYGHQRRYDTSTNQDAPSGTTQNGQIQRDVQTNSRHTRPDNAASRSNASQLQTGRHANTATTHRTTSSTRSWTTDARGQSDYTYGQRNDTRGRRSETHAQPNAREDDEDEEDENDDEDDEDNDEDQ